MVASGSGKTKVFVLDTVTGGIALCSGTIAQNGIACGPSIPSH
jgi:hypothetical protein